jgi:CDP-diacylglycerol--glycerol-3-phosphate 3-phosphatidyltransferase
VTTESDVARGTLARTKLPEPPLTYANLVTWLRIAGSTMCFTMAAARSDPRWNLAGLVVYWALDLLDGFLARALHQETRMGAQMDIIADRLLITFFYYNHLAGHPALLAPVGLFLFEYVGLDLYLSIQFLRWPIVSPNYFYQVDRRIWVLNWSAAAKLGNTGLVTALNLVPGMAPVTVGVCCVLIGIKSYSWVRLHGLPRPEERWI